MCARILIMKKYIVLLCLISLSVVSAAAADTAAPKISPVQSGNDSTISSHRDHMKLNAAGYRLLGEKRYHEAEILFLRAAQQQPGSKYYHNNLAVAYMNQGKYHKAYSRLEIAIALDEGYIRALSNMAVTCFHLFKFREAYSYYRQVISLDTGYARNRFDRNRVIEKIESLKRENPRNKDLYYILRHLRTQRDVSP